MLKKIRNFMKFDTKASEQRERHRGQKPPQRYRSVVGKMSFLTMLLALVLLLPLVGDLRLPHDVLVAQGLEPHPGPEEEDEKDDGADKLAAHGVHFTGEPPPKKGKRESQHLPQDETLTPLQKRKSSHEPDDPYPHPKKTTRFTHPVEQPQPTNQHKCFFQRR